MAEKPKVPATHKTTVVATKQDVTPVRVTTPSMIVKVRNGAHDIKAIAGTIKPGKKE